MVNAYQLWPASPNRELQDNKELKVAQRNAFGTCWREAVASAELPAGTRFHDLRHFYASTLIAANLNPKVIQTRLGHATITETMDTYGNSQELHLMGENLQVAWSARCLAGLSGVCVKVT